MVRSEAVTGKKFAARRWGRETLGEEEESSGDQNIKGRRTLPGKAGVGGGGGKSWLGGGLGGDSSFACFVGTGYPDWLKSIAREREGGSATRSRRKSAGIAGGGGLH